MDNLPSESLEKIRQQFNNAPYPNTPLEVSAQQEYNLLYAHNLITPYYLKYRRVPEIKDQLILDAGCGSGYKVLALAEANPGARIIGVDISEESVKLARKRLEYHGFENAEFHALLIEDLPKLDLEFDYINCDEVLYLLPDPAAGLQAMKAVLKPQGIIRTNLHSALQRVFFYRAQELFKLMGLMDDNPAEFEIDIAVETMKSLKDETRLKAMAWKSDWETPEHKQEILSNHLLVGDKGFTIPDMFALLEATDLEFISMVNWRHWEVTDLFKDPDNLPAFWSMGLAGASLAEQLHLYELLHPVNRLLDWWCAQPNQAQTGLPLDRWNEDDWQHGTVRLHPQLQHDQAREDLIQAVKESKPYEISRYINMPALGPVLLESTLAACLLPLWESSQPVTALAERYAKIKPVHPATLEALSTAEVFEQVKQLLSRLEVFLYVLLIR